MENLYAIGFGGHTAAGKSTAVKYLVELMGATSFPCFPFSTSDYIGDLLNAKGIEPTKINRNKHAGSILREDPNALNDIIFEKIMSSRASYGGKKFVALIDSVRSVYQMEEWKRRIPSFEVIYVDADYELRFRRFNDRQRAEGKDPISNREFLLLHETTPHNNNDTLKQCLPSGHIIRNVGSMDFYHQSLQMIYIHYLFNSGLEK